MNNHRISRRSFLAAAGMAGVLLPVQHRPWLPLPPLPRKQPRAWS